MNKFLGLMVLGALAFSSCIKQDDTYKEMKPVAPGINIYNAMMTQNVIAMQPLRSGMRLAILLAEADEQQKTSETPVDFLEVKYNGNNIKDMLFGIPTKIEKQDDGDYKITYDREIQMSDGYFLEGSLLVKTNGKALLDDTSSAPGDRWEVVMDEFKVLAISSQGMQTVNMNSGSFYLFSNGNGSYSVMMNGVKATVDKGTLESDWSGAFTVTPKADGLAYSLCTGKDFEVTGSAQGPSFSSFDRVSATRLSYTADGYYKYAGTTFVGTQVGRLIGYGDYLPELYPDTEVKVTWTLEGSNTRPTMRIYYNGYTYPKQ